MRMTSHEIKGYQLKKGFRGYDIQDVENLREQAATALEEASREIMNLSDKLRNAQENLDEHIANERMLRDTLTTAQKMVEDLKHATKKETELLLAEARLQAEEIIRQAQSRSTHLQEETFRLRQQRLEIETSIKALINYHSAKLIMEEDESRKADSESEKLKFFSK
ncbi:MAG: DivIVA domain-containing protein [Deltaproteobacteria bacterium]|nr:DivIVA domain-containing protein [Deltaproteobacteria bacterium]